MTSERELTAPAAPARRLRPAPKTGLVGVPEIIGLSLSAMLLLAAVVAYFYLLLPARSHLRNLEKTRAETELNNRTLNVQVGNHNSAESLIVELTTSVTNFEQTALGSRTSGRTELITQLNDLMRQNSLRNTAGPTYAVMEQLDPNAPAASRTKTGDARFQTLFPGTSVNVTVEGGYTNIRRFIHDVEAMPQFVIVNTVELEDVAGNTSSAPAAPSPEPQMLNPRLQGRNAAPPVARAATSGGVSLRLGLTVYFRREPGPGAVGN
jgi:Tfp pilus assembly protein PilO